MTISKEGRFFVILAATVVVIAIWCGAVMAAPPDAGSILREIGDKPFQAPPPAKPEELIKPKTAPKEPEAKGPKVLVRGFKIKGATRFTEEQLKAVISGYIGRELSFGELDEIIKKLAAFYKERGYLARVYMPEQEIKDGIVEIVVVESRLESIEQDKDGKSRISFDRAKRYISNQQPEGELIMIEKMEKGMLLLNDLPGVTVTSSLEAGSKPGMSKQLLKLGSTPLVTANIDVDNTGSRSTGEYRAGLNVNLNNLSGIGDHLSLRTIESFDYARIRRSAYGRAAYTVPVGYSGLKIGVSAVSMGYKLGGDFKDMDGKGHSNTLGANLSYPFIRSRQMNLNGSLSYDHKQTYDSMNRTTTANKRLNTVTVGLSAGVFDSLGGGGVNNLSVNYVEGWLNRGRWQADLAGDQASARTQGEYKKIQTMLSRLQKVTEKTFLTMSLNNQWASKNLDSSEKFSLGGPSAVRAFPNSEATGDEGTVVSAEVKQVINGHLAVILFYDYGLISVNKKEWASTTTPNAYSLEGAGASVELILPWGIFAKGTVATRVGGNPGQNAAGRDNDGTKRDPRIWFTVNKFF